MLYALTHRRISLRNFKSASTFYRAASRTSALGGRLSNYNDFWKQKFLKNFLQTDQ